MTEPLRQIVPEAPEAALEALRGRKVAVMGYGAQGRAQALNLRDSGIDVRVVLRPGSAHASVARAEGLTVIDFDACGAWGDFFVFLTPDETQPDLYRTYLASHLAAGDVLCFAHGLNIHWRAIVPPTDVDVILVAPKGPGVQVRTYFERGSGLADVIAVAQDATGRAHDLAVAFACAIGGGRVGIVESTFREEAVSDLFGEQAVLCGGVLEMMKAGFDTLVAGGIAPELAYNECIQEMKLIVDLVAERGFAGTYAVISSTAAYGGYTVGRRLVTDATRAEMRRVLADIESGAFARVWTGEDAAEGAASYARLREEFAHEPVDEAGERARALFKPRGVDA